MAKLNFDGSQVAKLLERSPTVILVKDEGIYLISEKHKAGDLVVYAKGYDPKLGEHVWDKCRAAVGGDDFGETLQMTDPMVQAAKQGRLAVFTLNVTQTSISVEAIMKKVA